MRNDEKKAATAAYKERKSVAGIFCMRCAATGEVWVGQNRNLDQAPNRIWFTLRNGADRCATLQRAFNEHGEGALSFEILERAAEDEPGFALDRFLKDRLAHWRSTLAARAM